MRMSQAISGVYSDARSEYTRELCTILVPSYFKFFLDLLAKAKEGQEPKKFLWNFQTLLNDIPDWNMEKVSGETAQLLSSSGCDYMEDLLTGVLLAHTKVLLAIQHSSRKKKVQITVPKVEHFLFKVLCETSKLLWGSTFLFREDVSSLEKQQNYRSIEVLLSEGILQAIRAMVPLRNILKDLVSQDKGDEEDEEDEETEVEKKEPEAKKEEEPEAKKEEEPEAKKEEEKVAESKKEEEKEKVAESKKEEEAAVAEAKKEEEKAAEAQKEAADVVVHPVLSAMANFANNEIVTPPQPHIVIDTTRNVGFSDYKTLFDSDNPDQSDIVDMGDDQESESLNILDGDAEPLRFDDAETIGGSSFQPSNPEAIGDGDLDVLT
jgi:outer membrane biosynthesis protein TonB